MHFIQVNINNQDFSINCIAVSNDETLLAFGDANKAINLFPYKTIDNHIRKSASSKSENERFIIYPLDSDLGKVTIDIHLESVNVLAFTKTKYYLVSGSSDKSIAITRINHDLTYKNIRLIKTNSEVSEIVILPNDELCFVGCIDNNIYLYRSDFTNNQFDLYKTISLHQNYVTSICLDPFLEKALSNASHIGNSLKFVSYVKKNLFRGMMVG